MSLTETILSQLHGDVLGRLRRADRLWQSLKENTDPAKPVVTQSQEPLGSADWDVVVAGGTLGIFIAAALALRGWRVAVLERGYLRGREQEWNISRSELGVLEELNLLTPEQLEQAIATEYNPARIQFGGSREFWVRDVLNLGADPVYLLEALKSRFLESGGKLFEKISFSAAVVHPDGVAVETDALASEISGTKSAGEAGGAGGDGAYASVPATEVGHKQGKTFKTRLLLDVMGHFSPIVRQARQGQKPDSVCLVVGSCAKGFPKNDAGDLMVSFTPMQNQCQYFWEAFPARSGRTTYLFTYIDAHPQRMSLEELFEDYLRLLPEYQGLEGQAGKSVLEQLEFVRALFGFFPSYRQSPLRSPWDRLLFVGDSSASQSPLSFGGFGTLLRHLKRLTSAIDEALHLDRLGRRSLSQLMPYQPSLSVAWMFQRAMTVGVEQNLDPKQINQLLSSVFECMEELGDPVLKPFLQDVVQFKGLSQTLFKMTLTQPGLALKIIPQVGLLPLIDWMQHYINLGAYSALYTLGRSLEPWVESLPAARQYVWRRWIDAWKYGSGGDRATDKG